MKFDRLQKYSNDELKEMFDPQGNADLMEFDVVVSHIHEMRDADPDNIDMSDAEIASALQS